MFQLILSGLALGCIYSLVALGYHVTFITSRTLNFAQGSAVMLGRGRGPHSGRGLSAGRRRSRWPRRSCCSGMFGLALERLAVRPFVSRGSMAWVMSTLAVGIIVENVGAAGLRQVAARAAERTGAGSRDHCREPGIYPLELLIPVVVLLVAVGARLFYGGPCWAGRCVRPLSTARPRSRSASTSTGWSGCPMR